MGFPSYQEDIQDAKGEPVKAGKQKDQVIVEELEELEELVESDPKTEALTVKNTVIVKADGLAINSIEMESYACDITFMDSEAQLEPQIDLSATARADGKVFHISTFYDIKEACSLLTALMLAIENGEEVFNVRKRNSNVRLEIE